MLADNTASTVRWNNQGKQAFLYILALILKKKKNHTLLLTDHTDTHTRDLGRTARVRPSFHEDKNGQVWSGCVRRTGECMCSFPSTVADAETGSHLGLGKSSGKVGSSDTEAVSVFVVGTGIKLLKTLQTVIFFPPSCRLKSSRWTQLLLHIKIRLR